MNKTLLLLSFFTGILAFSSAQEISYRILDLNALMGKKTIKEINLKIYRAALHGELPAYKTKSLYELYNFNELIKKGSAEDIIEVCPYPDRPKYCYDTTIIIPFHEKGIAGNIIAEKWSSSQSNKTIEVEYYAMALDHYWSVYGMDLGPQPLFWFKLSDLNKVLTANEVLLFKKALFKETQLYYSELSTFSIYWDKPINQQKIKAAYEASNRSISLKDYIGIYTLEELNMKLYNAVITNKIKGYATTKLDDPLSKKDIEEKNWERLVTTCCPDPEYPDYCFDSIIYLTQDSSRITINAVSESLDYNQQKNTYTTQLKAYALCYSSEHSESHERIFWIRARDLKKVLKKYEIDMIKSAIYKATVDLHYRDFPVY
jgi:hypothetical protein